MIPIRLLFAPPKSTVCLKAFLRMIPIRLLFTPATVHEHAGPFPANDPHSIITYTKHKNVALFKAPANDPHSLLTYT